MARKFQDMAAKAGKYTDREGKEKNRYQHVGKLVTEDDGRQWGTLEFLGMEISFTVFDQKERDGGSSSGQQQARSAPRQQSPQAQQGRSGGGAQGLDDDIPF